MTRRSKPRPPAPVNDDDSQTIDRIGLYEQLRHLIDEDILHQLIAANGPEILDKGLPYVLIAARNRRRSAFRRLATRSETSVADLDAHPSSLWNPLQRLEQQQSVRTLLAALATLDDADFIVVWRHAEGYSDSEIREEWDALKFVPASPSAEYLRKRRERARKRLRDLIGPLKS